MGSFIRVGKRLLSMDRVSYLTPIAGVEGIRVFFGDGLYVDYLNDEDGYQALRNFIDYAPDLQEKIDEKLDSESEDEFMGGIVFAVSHESGIVFGPGGMDDDE